MSNQHLSANLDIKNSNQHNWIQQLLIFLLFFFCEAAIFIFGSYYFDVFATNRNLIYGLAISVIFLGIALWFKFNDRLSKYWRIPFAFFIAAIVTPITAISGGLIRTVLGWFSVSVDTSQGLAIEKICEMLLKVIPIIVLVKLSGANFGSIYLSRGNLKLGLGIGFLVFFFLAPASFMFAAQRFSSTDTLMAAVVWGLVFSIANAFMEELWLRGIFLKHFEQLIGLKGSVWVTSLIFASMHSFAYYFMPEALPFFFLNTLALGLACGYLTMKSKSIWGAVIIHMASDFFLFVAVLANA
jgi:membrane protease YdiL (CAAX protease family)